MTLYINIYIHAIEYKEGSKRRRRRVKNNHIYIYEGWIDEYKHEHLLYQ